METRTGGPEVFLCHASSDKPIVRHIARGLRGAGVTVWFDSWEPIPGEIWLRAIEEALRTCRCIAVFIGPHGLSHWQAMELGAIWARSSEPNSRVILVLLPGVKRGERDSLPLFLRASTWVEFATEDDEEALRRLIAAIRGLAPEPLPSPMSAVSVWGTILSAVLAPVRFVGQVLREVRQRPTAEGEPPPPTNPPDDEPTGEENPPYDESTGEEAPPDDEPTGEEAPPDDEPSGEETPSDDEPSGIEPPPPPSGDTRSVCAEVLTHGTREPCPALPKSGKGWIDIWIGWPRSELSAEAETAFPSREVPRDDRTLTVVLSELSGGAGPEKAPPALRKITLPISPEQESDAARFEIRVGSDDTYCARVIILHRNRVLQTWLLRVPIGRPGRLELTAEAQLQPSVTSLDPRQPFDAALIFNHDDRRIPGVTSIAGDVVSFVEPQGLDKELNGISSTLGRLTELKDLPGTLAHPDVLSVLRSLAHRGRILWDFFEARLAGLAGAKRIQIVEAREGAYFPVEFFYTRPAPRDGAPLCQHAIEALRTGDALNKKCPTDDDSVVCPTAFWGFSRVIERWAHQTEVLGRSELELSVPHGERRYLDLSGTAIIGASRNVREEDLAPDSAIVRAIESFTQAPPCIAPKWDDWRVEIEKRSPSLLILLAHSRPHPDDDIASLEIGDSLLRSSGIEKPYVVGPKRTAGPVVLLLGCTTLFPEVPLQNFVARFRTKGASLVVGTLSVVLGRHAGSFTGALLAELKNRRCRGEATFGDAFLAAKQALLASGNPYALTVVAYGDAEWRI